MSDWFDILTVTVAVSALSFAALWGVSVVLRDPSFIDAWWAFGVVLLAWTVYVQLPAPSAHAHALMLLASAWGLRLGAYLFWRWGTHGKDHRYAALAESAHKKYGMSFAAFSALWVFGPQMLLQIVMSLPATLGQLGAEPRAFTGFAYAGVWIAVIGIVYEGVADGQLAHFKSVKANAGKLMDRGLWRYSRHPNYFGEMVAWWGMWLVAADAGFALWTLPGPVLLMFLLINVSGAPTTEPHLKRTRPEYEAYRARTSAFFPLPPMD